MSGQINLSIDSLQSAVSDHWGLQNTLLTLIAARENRVYRLDTSQGTYALRLHRPGYRSLQQIRSELLWMSMLSNNGLQVPHPIPTTDNTLVKSIDGTLVDVLTWLEGKPMSQVQPSADDYLQLGRLLAQMHKLADQWTLPEYFDRPTWDLLSENPSWGRFWENPLLSKEQRTELMTFRDKARDRLLKLTDPDTGLIHADLVPDNVIFEKGIPSPIDFDDGGFGFRLFDLATITRRSRSRDGTDVFADAAITGYTENRTIDEHELVFFEALRACSYVGWNISRLKEPNALERNSRFITEAELAIYRLKHH